MLCIGYAGCEAFDVVLYISRTLTKLNYRVLIIDLSASGALFHSIKHGMGLDSSEGIINYRDINYTRIMPQDQELEAFRDGIVFINYGLNFIRQCKVECKTMNIVVNTFPNTIKNVNDQLQNFDWQAQDYRLLIRDITVIDDVDRVKKEVASKYFGNVSYLYLEINDYESAVHCQLSQIIRFTGISSQMQKYILEQIHSMLPHLTYHKIKRAMALAKKGV